MFQTISFPNTNVGIESSNARGSLGRPQATTNDYTKQHQQPLTTLGVSATDPEASLPGSVSGEGSSQSSATPNSVYNSTTASNGGDRRASTGEMQQQQQQQPQASPSTDDFGGQRYDSYIGRNLDDDDSERSKLKFRRRIMGMGVDKAGIIRRYHRRSGVGAVGRPRGRRGILGRFDAGNRWTQLDGSGSSLQGFEAAYDEDSQDAFTPPDEAIYRSNANLSSSGLNDSTSSKPSHSAFSDGPNLFETTVATGPETPPAPQSFHQHQHSLHTQPPQTQPPISSQSSTNATPPTSSASIMMMSHYHHHPQQQQPLMDMRTLDKRVSQESMHDPAALDWRNNAQRHSQINGPGRMNNPIQSDVSGPPPPQTLTPGRSQISSQQTASYHQHHSSPLPTSPNHHQQQGPPPPPSMQPNASQPQSQPPPPLLPSQSTNPAADMGANHGGGASTPHGPTGTPTPPGGASGSSSEPTTVVTFFVCEVCASRYRSTAGLRYHYHSQHAGYTPRNPISASASRISIPTSEYNRFAPNTGPRGGRNGRTKRSRNNYPSYRSGTTNKGRGLSAVNQQIVNQRSGSQAPGGGGESDSYHMASGITPEDSHSRSVYSSSSEPQQTESSLSSVNSSSYISPITLKSANDLDYSAAGQRGKAFMGYPPPLPPLGPTSSNHQPPLPPYDQHPPFYGAPSALASMDHMASSLLRQQQQQSQVSQPLHSLLAQLHPTSYKPFGDAPSSHYYAYQQRSYAASGRPSFAELKGMLRQRRSQYPVDAFTCGYCQMHVEGGGSGDNREEGEGVSYSRCFGCGMPVHNFCILRYRGAGSSRTSRASNNQRLCYPWVCTECKSCWICGSGANEELIICCCECDRGYHGYCLTGSSPGYQPTSFPDDWMCEICRQQDACLPQQQPPTIH